MGLSLSVLVALCVLLPGATFVFGLTRLHSPTSPATPLDQHITVGLAVALVAALLFQGAWLGLWRLLLDWAGAPLPDVTQAVGLLAGDLKTNHAQDALASLQSYPIRIACYFVGLTLLTWYLGRKANGLLPNRRTASWFDLLRPQDAAFVWLTTDLHLDDQCYLFAGWVKEFSVAKCGNLERVVLGYAIRRPLNQPPAEEGIDIGHGWMEIPGEFVVLQMGSAQTVNVDYFFENGASLEDQPVTDEGIP